MNVVKSIYERLLAKTDKNGALPAHAPELGPCWNWTGFKHSLGYGQMANGPRGSGVSRTHKVAFEASYGPIAEGLEIDHLCRNRGCVNPAHLEAVTHQENSKRAAAHGTFGKFNREKTQCRLGHLLDGVDNRGARYCKTCGAARTLKRYYQKKAALHDSACIQA